MTGAALALAAALLIVPSSSRHRLVMLGLARRRTFLPRRPRAVVPLLAAVAVVSAAVVPVAVVLAAATVGATLLSRRRRRATQRRVECEWHALETALDVLVGELRSGAHPVAAFRAAATETGGAVGASFEAVASRAILGADVSAGLRAVAATSATPAAWERLALCWDLGQTHGLAMATLMRAAQSDIVERTRFAARVNAGMAGARATAGVLAALPLAGIALGELIGARPLRFLVGGGTGGWLLLI
ncbi:MAG TPA: type II secretion system F family protein, partial [Mycobacterium sp.]|nr:type II secretion system F family protein [Mycobacterium sp.]